MCTLSWESGLAIGDTTITLTISQDRMERGFLFYPIVIVTCSFFTAFLLVLWYILLARRTWPMWHWMKLQEYFASLCKIERNSLSIQQQLLISPHSSCCDFFARPGLVPLCFYYVANQAMLLALGCPSPASLVFKKQKVQHKYFISAPKKCQDWRWWLLTTLNEFVL